MIQASDPRVGRVRDSVLACPMGSPSLPSTIYAAAALAAGSARMDRAGTLA